MKKYHVLKKIFLFVLSVALLMAAIPFSLTALAETGDYELQENTVKNSNGVWVTNDDTYDPKYENYNCYAYAIHRAEQPMFYSTIKQYEPGNIVRLGHVAECSSPLDIALLVMDDLEAMGCTVDREANPRLTLPTTIDPSKELICVRTTEFGASWDYHFMRYDHDENAWLHKPGTSAVLKYNGTPSNSVPWNEEGVYRYGISASGRCYNSDIYFIEYSMPKLNITIDNPTATLTKLIKKNKDIMCEIKFNTGSQYTLQLGAGNSGYPIYYELYDKDFNLVLSGNGTSISESGVLARGSYYLRVNFESGTPEYNVNISVTHTHEYDRWAPYSSTHHKEQCLCGALGTVTAPHAIVAPPTPNITRVRCLDCGAWVNVPDGFIEVPALNITQVTLNGSYIRPDGIIVLAEEDIEAYLNGTLVFYNKDDLPQIE